MRPGATLLMCFQTELGVISETGADEGEERLRPWLSLLRLGTWRLCKGRGWCVGRPLDYLERSG